MNPYWETRLEPEFCEWVIRDFIVFENAPFCGLFEVWILLFMNISIVFYRRCIPKGIPDSNNSLGLESALIINSSINV